MEREWFRFGRPNLVWFDVETEAQPMEDQATLLLVVSDDSDAVFECCEYLRYSTLTTQISRIIFLVTFVVSKHLCDHFSDSFRRLHIARHTLPESRSPHALYQLNITIRFVQPNWCDFFFFISRFLFLQFVFFLIVHSWNSALKMRSFPVVTIKN